MKKEFRIKKSDEIEAIVKGRKSTGSKHFVVYIKQNHENTRFRFAVSVSKKYGNAVSRNKIKRQVKEIVSKLDIKTDIDVFVVIKVHANTLQFTEIEQSITRLVKKHNILR